MAQYRFDFGKARPFAEFRRQGYSKEVAHGSSRHLEAPSGGPLPGGRPSGLRPGNPPPEPSLPGNPLTGNSFGGVEYPEKLYPR